MLYVLVSLNRNEEQNFLLSERELAFHVANRWLRKGWKPIMWLTGNGKVQTVYHPYRYQKAA
jgi:hypothetical protein